MSYATGPGGDPHNTMTKRMTEAMPKAHGNGIQSQTKPTIMNIKPTQRRAQGSGIKQVRKAR